MKYSPAKIKIITAVLLAGVLPFLVSVAAHLIIGDAKHVQEPLHESFELAGCCIALGVAMILLLRLRHENASSHLLWVAAALVAMGIVDGLHGFLPTGVAFSWTRHGATLVGGVLFALVWLPLPAVVVRRKQHFILLVAVLAIAGSFAIWCWPERLPAPWVAGNYSRSVIATNALGGLGFLAAAVFFIRRYLREPQGKDLVFVSHTLLFGTASLFFGFSHVWAADWWVWHGARLLAYSIVLVAAHNTLVALFGRIARHAKEQGAANAALRAEMAERKRAEDEIRKLSAELEQRVIERTAELDAANKELEAFAYSVSHDLRAPLRSIDGFSQALLQDYPDKLDEQGKNYLQRVRSNTQRMGELIDDLLKLSRVTRSEMKLEMVNLSTLAHSITSELHKTQPERQVEFVISPALSAKGDMHLLRLMLENLLGNAWKFTGKHPQARIEVSTTQVDSKLAFIVRDDGAGFDMTYADKLFAPFQRLHSASEFPGSGIGLATAQRIVSRHGGRVWAEGKIEKGATFYFTLGEM